MGIIKKYYQPQQKKQKPANNADGTCRCTRTGTQRSNVREHKNDIRQDYHTVHSVHDYLHVIIVLPTPLVEGLD